MKLDEAIVHAREVAERNRNQYKNCPSDRTDIRHQTCEECAKEHDQLAEWLEELKQYRAIGTVEQIKNAMKNFKSKEVVEISETVIDFKCPCCGSYVYSAMENGSGKWRPILRKWRSAIRLE